MVGPHIQGIALSHRCRRGRLAEAALGERQQRLSERMAALEGHAIGHGGNAVEELRTGRPR